MSEATLYKDAETLVVTVPTGGYTSGEVLQLPDGRAAYVEGLRSLDAGERANLQVGGTVDLAKIANKVVLAGGKVYWDRSAGTASPIKTADSFYVGVAVADAAASDTTVRVLLNGVPRYHIELDRMGSRFVSAPIGTSQTATRNVGGEYHLALSNTDEAGKVDLLSVDSVPVADGPIFECVLTFDEKGDNAAVDINFGLANNTHDSDCDAITESVFFHVDGNSADICAESDDGTTEVNATDTTVDLTEDTYNEFWIDARDPSSVKLYIDGVRVLSGTTFVLSNATGPMKALVHVEKSGGTHVPSLKIESLTVRSTDLA